MGWLPIIRRRITACGVSPLATVAHPCDNFSLSGAVAPTTGERCFLELPWLNARVFQRWVDHFAVAFPQSFNLLGLDNSAGHTAKVLRWPANVAPVFLPPYSPARNPIERRWRDRKDQLAGSTATTIDAWSEAVCTLIRSYVPATLTSLTSFAYFVQAVEAARKTTYV